VTSQSVCALFPCNLTRGHAWPLNGKHFRASKDSSWPDPAYRQPDLAQGPVSTHTWYSAMTGIGQLKQDIYSALVYMRWSR